METNNIIPKTKTLRPYIYGANMLLSLHYYLIIYINSSSLERLFSQEQVGFLYIMGAVLGLLLFISAPSFISRGSLYAYFFIVTALECVAVLGLASATSLFATTVYFLLHNSMVPMMFFCLDMFLEEETSEENETGKIRSTFLTISNTILVISPLITGFVLEYYSFNTLYLISALICIPLLLLARLKLKRASQKQMQEANMLHSFKIGTQSKDIKNVLIAQFILQFFYAWMVVYTPIYLVREIGFSWQAIGSLFTIMLLPFALFEIPVGWLADKKYGEKEFMVFGFLIIAVSTALIPFAQTSDFYIWATLLFLTRTGASLAEITSESYFFKHVTSSDSDLISIFRMTRPLSYIMAPLLASLCLLFMPLGASFWVLGAISFLGSIAAFNITDTK